MSLHGRMAVLCLCVSLASSFSAWAGMLCFDRDAAFGTFCMCKKGTVFGVWSLQNKEELCLP